MRRVVLGVILAAVAIEPVAIGAGGWAVVTVETLPDAIVAGEATPLTFVVRQHGSRPLDGLQPIVQAVLGATTVVADASSSGAPGRYTALLTLPRSGSWTITIGSGFGASRLTLLPIRAVAPGARATEGTANPQASAARGQRLFVAKGCVTCHQSDIASDNVSLAVGQRIVAMKYQPEFLARILADPAASMSSSPRGAGGGMPNLHLTQTEIASLVAFINTPRAATAR
jgi:mono/diheme cytochrome c family protein